MNRLLSSGLISLVVLAGCEDNTPSVPIQQSPPRHETVMKFAYLNGDKGPSLLGDSVYPYYKDLGAGPGVIGVWSSLDTYNNNSGDPVMRTLVISPNNVASYYNKHLRMVPSDIKGIPKYTIDGVDQPTPGRWSFDEWDLEVRLQK